MNHVQFHGDPAVPDADKMTPNDRERLRSLIKLASDAKEHLGNDDVKIRKTFDRISMLYRLAASNLPVRTDGKVLEIDTAIQDELIEKKAEEKDSNQDSVPEKPQEASDAITYWGDYIFRMASAAASKSK